MQDLGLTTQERRWYEKALVSSSQQWLKADLYNRERKHTARLRFFEADGPTGQIILDTNTTAGRAASITVADPDQRLLLEDRVLFLDRLLKIQHAIFVPELDRVVFCPMFFGPVSKANDMGNNLIAIEAQGKEVNALGSVLEVKQYPKGARVSDVIRRIMLDAGEVRGYLDIPDRPEVLRRAFQISPDIADDPEAITTRWDAVQYLAGTIGCDIFYDGNSRCVMRPHATQVVYVFNQDAEIVTTPQVSTLLGAAGNGIEQGDTSSYVKNRELVIGHPKPGKDGVDPPPIRASRVVPEGNRFSPFSMGNPGSPLYLTDTFDSQHILTQATADRVAQNRLRRLMQQAAEAISFGSVVVPHLDPYDRCRVNNPDGTLMNVFDLMQATIPLKWSPDTPMTIGYVKRVFEPGQGPNR